MANIRLSIHDDHGKIHPVDAPAGIKTKDFIQELLEELRPGATDDRQEWGLYDHAGNALDPDQTLAENRVQAGRQLYLRIHQKKSATCGACSFENTPENKFCQKCGKPLTIAFIPPFAGSSAAAPAPAPVSLPVELKLHVHTPDGRSHPVEIPSAMKVSELIEDLVDRLNLSSQDVTAGKAVWSLRVTDAIQPLEPEKSLQENGVISEQHLYIDIRRISAPRPWKILAAVAVIVLVAVVAFLSFRSKPGPKPVGDATVSPTQSPVTTPTSTVTPSRIPTPTPTPKLPVSLTVVVAKRSLSPGEKETFSAVVNNTEEREVSWKASEGTILPNGSYQAPGQVLQGHQVTITATSMADRSKSASASIMLRSPVTVVVGLRDTKENPLLKPDKTLKLKATVTGANDSSVIWSIDPSGRGSISSKGKNQDQADYHSPKNFNPSGTNVTIIAKSKQDPSQSGSFSVTLVQK